MKHILKSAAIAASLLTASALPLVAAAQAQTLPPAVIMIVDMDTVYNNCAAGKLAAVELKTKADSIQARVNTLRTQLGAEEETLAKSQPTAAQAAARPAWEAKVREFQAKQQAGQNEIQQRSTELDASRKSVIKQITDAATPITSQIMRERGASIVLLEGATLQHSAAIDVTTDLIARLDKALPRVSTAVPVAPAK